MPGRQALSLFPYRQNETQTGQGGCPRSQSWWVSPNPKSLTLESVLLNYLLHWLPKVIQSKEFLTVVMLPNVSLAFYFSASFCGWAPFWYLLLTSQTEMIGSDCHWSVRRLLFPTLLHWVGGLMPDKPPWPPYLAVFGRFLALISSHSMVKSHDTTQGFSEQVACGHVKQQEVFGLPTLAQNAGCSRITVEASVRVQPHLAACEMRGFMDSLFARKSPSSFPNIVLVFASSIVNLFRFRNQDHTCFLPLWMHQGFEEEKTILSFLVSSCWRRSE